MLAKIGEGADDEIGTDRARWRDACAGAVYPDARDAKLLRLFDIPLEVVTNHPGLVRCGGELRERHLIDSLVGFAESDLTFNENHVEQRFEPEPFDLLPLHLGGAVRHQRQPASTIAQPGEHRYRAGKQDGPVVAA